MNMKSAIASLALIALPSAFAHATEAQIEALRVANVILDNAATAAQIKAENVNLVAYTATDTEPGVTTFKFDLDRTCFCMPKPGSLIIVQDRRPTFADGPIKYTVDLTWK